MPSNSAFVLRSAFVSSLVVAVPLVACDSCSAGEDPPPVAAVEPEPAPVAASTGNPLGELQPAKATEWAGIVESKLAAGSYTYLAVREADSAAELRWVATMGRGMPAGSSVTVHSYGVRKDFYSRRLDRSFAELEFASVEPLAKEGVH